MQNLSIAKVDADMGDSFLAFVNIAVGTFACPFVSHKEHEVANFKISPVRCCVAFLFHIIPLCAGVRWQRDSCTVDESSSHKSRTIKCFRAGAVGAKFIRCA